MLNLVRRLALLLLPIFLITIWILWYRFVVSIILTTGVQFSLPEEATNELIRIMNISILLLSLVVLVVYQWLWKVVPGIRKGLRKLIGNIGVI